MQRTVQILMIVLTALLISGCAVGKSGTVNRNAEVDSFFKAGAIPTEYRYYYFGERQQPVAILGIKKEYTLQTGFWKPIVLSDAQMEKWRKYFKDSFGWYDNSSRQRLMFAGYSLTDPQGEEAGVLYSLYDWVVIKFPEKNIVVVYPPQPRIKDPLLAPAQ
jgi:hypothetical protein